MIKLSYGLRRKPGVSRAEFHHYCRTTHAPLVAGVAATLGVRRYVQSHTIDTALDAAIADGDCVVIRQQPTANNVDIVAAMIEGEATVQPYKRKDGNVWLMPHNYAFSPMPRDEYTILVRVVTLMRNN